MGVESIINQNRFRSKIEPGIYGIVYRLCMLDFVDNVPNAKAGRAQNNDRRWENNGEMPVEHGLMSIDYKLDTKRNRERAKRFHRVISKCEVYNDGEGASYRIYVGHDSAGIDLRMNDWGRGFKKKNVVSVLYDVVADVRGKATKSGTLNALCEFWQKFSGIIRRYELIPVNEHLKPGYFSMRGSGKRLYLPK